MVATIFVRRIQRKLAGASVARCELLLGVSPSIEIMLGPSRPLPSVGTNARIVHFGGSHERCRVTAVHEDGRRVEVVGESGERLEFVLSPATARFVSAESAHGPRLELLG
jgi:hypothetical protein